MRAGSELPLVAVVGRPNVGKSTLYNRLVGGRPAMVEDEPGVTRDRRYGKAEWAGRVFEVVDTGGLDPSAPANVVQAGIHRQAARALDEADVIVFVTDAREGVTGTDREVAKQLRKLGRPVVLAANKVDGQKQEDLAAEMYALGLGDVVPVSATHGRGTAELCDAIVERLPPGPVRELGADEGEGEAGATEAPAPGELKLGPIRLAFLGRPNVGKSSLVNRLLGEERVLVHDQPGTTTDPVDTPFSFDGREFVLVDTAGIRKRARVEAPTEKIAVSMALGQLERADVVALVIDATQGPSDQDAKVGGAAEQAGAAVIILVNKVDALGGGPAGEKAQKDLTEKIRETLPFLSFAPIRFVSARTGAGVTDALRLAGRVATEHTRRVTTSELNKFFAEVCETHPPPTYRSRPVRIHYLTQVKSRPPTFVLWSNRPELVHHAYRRFLVNQLRARFGFEGTPLRVVTRAKGKS
jgi:GTP-binding protein